MDRMMAKKLERIEKAMEKLIEETHQGIVKWYRWGSTDSLEKPKPSSEEGGWSMTIPNWSVYYTKLAGTHVTVENHLGDQRFNIYWGPPVARGSAIPMDMEKELPLMDELLMAIRKSNPESLPKWRFQYIDENKGPECWWMKQEKVWHTVRATLDAYLSGAFPNGAGEEPVAPKKEEEDRAYRRIPVIRDRYIINVWETMEPEYEITKHQVAYSLYNYGTEELASRSSLEECFQVIKQHHDYYYSPPDENKVKEWEKNNGKT